jgi:hypothetical protein
MYPRLDRETNAQRAEYDAENASYGIARQVSLHA